MSVLYWTWVAPVEALPMREGRAVVVGGRELALFNLGDRVIAVDNRCPHQGGPLADGIVAGASVVCPLHGWKLNLAVGVVERPANTRHCVHTYATRIDNGVVVVGLPAADEDAAGEAA